MQQVNERIPAEQSAGKTKRAIKMPHVYVVLIGLLIFCYILTLVVPSGQYERVSGDNGMNMVVPGSFQYVDVPAPTPFDLLFSIPSGLVQAGTIIFGGFMMGALFVMIEKTGLLAIVIQGIMKVFSKHRIWSIPAIMLPMAAFTSITGALELILIYVPIMIPLMIRLGYDRFTAFALVIVANAAGFSVALTAPATVGLAQTIAELPLYSALGYRLAVLLAVFLVGAAYVMSYARRIEKNPQLGYTYGDGLDKEFADKEGEAVKMTGRHLAAIITLAAGIGVMVYGLIQWKWYFIEIGGWYAFLTIAIGLISGFGASKIADIFTEGMKTVIVAVVVIGLARAISVILEQGQILDTIVHAMTTLVDGLPATLAAVSMLVVQTGFNFLVGSGSGQALITMPIMSALSDILGVTRQTAVLAFQFGDGFSNIIYPTGLVFALLAYAKLSYIKWLKFILPLVLGWYVLSAVVIVIAQQMGL